GEGQAAVLAVQDINVEFQSGEFVAIMGESGSGKSTLLSLLGALNTPTSGKYWMDTLDVYALKPDQRADFRLENLGFVFQSFHLVPYLTVLENVMLPMTTKNISKKKKQALAGQALAQVGLDQKRDRLPNQLSGGEQERVAIARAVVNDPGIILADEPTGNLDSKNSKGVMELFQSLNAKGIMVIMVTHSMEWSRYAHRILWISDGCLTRDEKN
ncbi:MAG: ABC transporter ATP-binding protein, partial [Desulfobacca sp.]|nr:ABC transporter ATP-binding protein [Desulfobacca sp.]